MPPARDVAGSSRSGTSMWQSGKEKLMAAKQVELKDVVEVFKAVISQCFNALFCFSCIFAFAGIVLGVIIGCVLIRQGPVCFIGFILAFAVLGLACFVRSKLMQLYNSVNQVLEIFEIIRDPEQMKEKLKEVAKESLENAADYGIGIVFDSLMSQLGGILCTELVMMPSLVLLVGVVMLCVGAVIDMPGAVGEICLTIGVLGALAGLACMAVGGGIYCFVGKKLQSALTDVKTQVLQRLEAGANPVIDAAVDRVFEAVAGDCDLESAVAPMSRAGD